MATAQQFNDILINITYCIYYNDQSSWGVFEFETENYFSDKGLADIGNKKYRGKLYGNMPRLECEQSYNIDAKLAFNKKYGAWQFELVSARLNQPSTKKDIITFLQFTLTEQQANVLYKEYPNIIDLAIKNKFNTIDIQKLHGIGQKTLDKIYHKINNNYVLFDIISYLAPHGVSYNKINKIVNHFGSPLQAKTEIQKNFYILTAIGGIGFKITDKIALKLKPNLKENKNRLVAYLQYTLNEIANNDGHTLVKKDKLMGLVRKDIPECSNLFKEYMAEIKNNQSEIFTIVKNQVCLQYHYDIELNILNEINRIKNSHNFVNGYNISTVNGIITNIEQQQGFIFSADQKQAIFTCLDSNFVIISGVSGSGKTSTVNGIIRVMDELYPNISFKQCALSAKAARRMYEVTGKPAYTIHKTLGYNGDNFTMDGDNPIGADFIIADEFSMNNTYITLKLFQAVKTGSKLILVYDHAQLPPIGAGSVATDLLKFGDVPKFKFDTVYRQENTSNILVDANLVRNMESPIQNMQPKVDRNDIIYYFSKNRESLHQKAIDIYMSALERYDIDDIMLICPRKNTVINSVENFNINIQKRYITHMSEPLIKRKKYNYYVNDRIIHKKNNGELQVVNGEVGTIKSIYDNTMIVNFGLYIEKLMEDGEHIPKNIQYPDYESINETQLGYSFSCHSAQGSEAAVAIIVLDNTHYTLLDTTLLYTAITRAKEKCFVIAEPSAFVRCIKNHKTYERNTLLSYFLQQ